MSSKSKLPLPVWLIVILFVVGGVAGLGVGVLATPDDVTFDYKSAERAKRAWKSRWARKTPPKKEKKAEKKEAKAEAEPRVKPDDARLLANHLAGPTKTHLQKNLEIIRPKVEACFDKAEKEHPGEVSGRHLLVEYEVVGKMATIIGVNAFGDRSGDIAVQGCVLKSTADLLLEFKSRDGMVEVIYTFDPPPEAKQEKGGKTAKTR